MERSKQETEKLSVSDADHQHSFLRRFTPRAALYCGGAVLAGSYAVPAMFGLLGFTSTGVTIGSMAASWQAVNFLPGCFSFIQSASATNALGATIAKVGICSGLLGAYHGTKKSSQDNTKVDKKLQIRSKL